jgi:hypothetical protein
MLWRKPPRDIAKVGVEGSNPFARSKFSQGNQSIEMALRGRFGMAAAAPGRARDLSSGLMRRGRAHRLQRCARLIADAPSKPGAFRLPVYRRRQLIPRSVPPGMMLLTPHLALL